VERGLLVELFGRDVHADGGYVEGLVQMAIWAMDLVENATE